MQDIRIHISLPVPLAETFAKIVPRGIRSTICRSIIKLIIDAIEKHGSGIIGLIIAGDIILVPNPRSCQILAQDNGSTKDEERDTLTKAP